MKRVSLIAFAFAAVTSAQATVLIFETSSGGSITSFTAPSGEGYGDRVTATTQDGFNYGLASGATANVVVDYSGTSSNPQGYGTGYGDLSNVIWGSGSSVGENIYRIKFTADAGWLVRLRRLDAAAWPGGQPSSTIRILNSANQELTSFSGLLPQSGHLTIDYSLISTVVDTSLTIEVSQGWWHALDNIEFSQEPVPEPATMAILGLAAAGLAARRRKS
ncbi:MAG: PEP-CTERM sorting domain-containing protein [Armatimonadetes bacterium]|nr:PEP-CTERM sorting domain-containing protein [Armatimonadota bacterium]